MPSIVALCGGVGGAKLAYGFAQVLAPHELAIVVNTGDDFDHFGLDDLSGPGHRDVHALGQRQP